MARLVLPKAPVGGAGVVVGGRGFGGAVADIRAAHVLEDHLAVAVGAAAGMLRSPLDLKTWGIGFSFLENFHL
jgi:hypothetical protein